MSNITLSNCVNRIKESPTLAITAKAAKLKSEGKDIIALAAGEPDFDTPDFIKEAAIQAIKDGLTKYTPVTGLPLYMFLLVMFSTFETVFLASGSRCGSIFEPF